MGWEPSLTKADIYKRKQQREREDKITRARNLYNQGMSLYDISDKVKLPEWVLVSELGLG